MRRAAIFIRVGATGRAPWKTLLSLHQDPIFQENLLRELIARRAWRLVRVYREVVSRPRGGCQGMRRMLADARRGVFDVIVMRGFNHFIRALADPATAVGELQSR